MTDACAFLEELAIGDILAKAEETCAADRDSETIFAELGKLHQPMPDIIANKAVSRPSGANGLRGHTKCRP